MSTLNSSYHSTSNAEHSSSATPAGMSPELERTLSLLSSHRSVLGYMLIARGEPLSIIRHSGVIFEGEQGKKYAGVIGKIVDTVHEGLEDISGSETDSDEIRFMRIRTRRHEIMISPDDRYLLAVLHDPSP
ncbi:hypothetical protein DL96DRAFT_1611656 [Flagelloscypha sp. PMI_526]|nr:hypothetical protein DL96DRAFT_1611656 [Flagelloscypha sp. PMI_526]